MPITDIQERRSTMIDCAWCPMPADDSPLCAGCLDAAAHDIAALPADHTALSSALPQTGGLQQRVSGTRAPSVPVDLLADEIARGIAWCLAVWEPPVREAAGLPPAPERVPPDVLVERAARLLSWRVRDFAALGDTWGYPEGLERGCVARRGLYGMSSCRRLHARAQVALGVGAPLTHLPGLCGLCGAAALVRSGSDPVECRHCGHRTDAEDYRALLGLNGPGVHHPIR